MPKVSACFLVNFPVGIGLRHVLDISESRSDSYHMFSAPAAPDPIATANKEITEFDSDIGDKEIIIPTIQVNSTKDITLGFIRLKKDCKLNTNPSFVFLDFVNIWLNLFYFR